MEAAVPISRRRFIGLGVGGLAIGSTLARAAGAQQPAGPFRHGVASFDPLPDRVLIWTRVTPGDDSLPGSAAGPDVDVRWEVAEDPDFAHVVASGTTVAGIARDHTVAVDVTGLGADRHHWYRFHALGAQSPVGRTRTAPAADAGGCVRLGVVTCAEFEYGFFTAYRNLAAIDDLAAVLHLGDYIYEFGLGYGTPPAAAATPGGSIGRAHEPPHETLTLADYRTRYGQYRTDAGLQALHATHPFIVMYDDHEVANDTWRDGAENHDPETEGPFAARAAAARQAFGEWLPVRRPDPADPGVVHRRFRFGDLAELWVLDERRYRDEQPTNAFFSYGSVDPAINDPNRTMLGHAQRDWLLSGLRSSTAAWRILGNPVPLFPFVVGPSLASAITTTLEPLRATLPPLPPPLIVDDWNGYAAEQRTLIAAMEDVGDVLVLTGDYHESFAADVPARPGDYSVDGNSAGVEFVAPSVTSPGLGKTLETAGLPATSAVQAVFAANLTASNPWVRYHADGPNGFGVIELTADRAQYDFWYVDDLLDPAAGARPVSSWEVRRGTNRLAPAGAPLAGAACAPAAAASPAPAAATTGGTPTTARPTLVETGGRAPRTLAGLAALAGAAALAAARAARPGRPPGGTPT